MLDDIQTKTCSKCKQIKPISEFFKNRNRKDGLSAWCKPCHLADTARRKQTPRVKARAKELRQRPESKKKRGALQRKYRQIPARQDWEKQYRHSPKRKTVLKRYNGSPKGRLCDKRYYYNHPDRAKAHSAVSRAVRDGKLPRAKTFHCAYCGKPAVEYHHHLGYEREHWLDVIPLCKQCHTD